MSETETQDAGIGHNSGDDAQQDNAEVRDVGGIAGARLKSFLERVERLNDEKSAIAEDIKEIYAEAKGVGFDAKTLRKIVALRKRMQRNGARRMSCCHFTCQQ